LACNIYGSKTISEPVVYCMILIYLLKNYSNFNSDGQQFNKFQQQKQLLFISYH